VRQLVDQNPAARIGLIGVLALAMMVLLYSQVLSTGSHKSKTPSASPTQRAPKSQTSTPKPAAAVSLPPGPGVPAKVAASYNAGKVVVVLVTQKNGIVDRTVESGARRLRARKSVAFFRVPVDKVSDYAGLTSGANIDRAPSLIVLTPAKAGHAPQAIVKEGFMDSATMLQALYDAVRPGKPVPAYPE
jgi:hypothetical protein